MTGGAPGLVPCVLAAWWGGHPSAVERSSSTTSSARAKPIHPSAREPDRTAQPVPAGPPPEDGPLPASGEYLAWTCLVHSTSGIYGGWSHVRFRLTRGSRPCSPCSGHNGPMSRCSGDRHGGRAMRTSRRTHGLGLLSLAVAAAMLPSVTSTAVAGTVSGRPAVTKVSPRQGSIR